MLAQRIKTLPGSFSSFLTLATVLTLVGTGCKSAPKKTTPELSELIGKKVALVEVLGEATARQATEVALINQLTRRGTFILISKQEVQAARTQFQQDPSDWKGIAKRAGADFALKARVLEFKSDQNTGYSTEQTEDSQLEAETGNGKTERLYKAKSLTGSVKVELQFANLETGDTRVGTGEKTGQALADERNGAAHLPPRLSFLTGLLEQCFEDFFEKYR